MAKLFTPSFADRSNTNAQNMAVKGGVARVNPLRLRVVMLGGGAADPRTPYGPRLGKGARHLC